MESIEQAIQIEGPRKADPKWAAIVGDVLVPMPRRRLKAKDILSQSGAPLGSILVRDFNSRNDVGFQADSEIDLAEGNVFRIETGCRCSLHVKHDAPAKLAFVVDDEWEVTTAAKQTGESLRGLLNIPSDRELFQDFESPADEPIADDDHISFSDGPVFRTSKSTITVKVNTIHTVTFQRRIVTGLQFKQTAIAQNVPIDLGFVVYRVGKDGGLSAAIGNDEKITLADCDEFRCVAPDDNS